MWNNRYYTAWFQLHAKDFLQTLNIFLLIETKARFLSKQFVDWDTANIINNMITQRCKYVSYEYKYIEISSYAKSTNI